ncbi:MAG: hypothetical protein AAF585_04555 [Verrucomicrobiota bacterium]
MKLWVTLLLLSIAGSEAADRIRDERTGLELEGEILAVEDDVLRMRLESGALHSVPKDQVKILGWHGVRNAKDLFDAGQQLLGEGRVHFQANRFEEAANAFARAKIEFEQIKEIADQFFKDEDQRYFQRAGFLIRGTCIPMQEEAERRQREAVLSRARTAMTEAASELITLFNSEPQSQTDLRRQLENVDRRLSDARRDYAEADRLQEAARSAAISRGVQELLRSANLINDALYANAENLDSSEFDGFTQIANRVMRTLADLERGNLATAQQLAPARRRIEQRKSILRTIPTYDQALAAIGSDVRRLRAQFDRDEHLGFLAQLEIINRKLDEVPSDELIPRQHTEYTRLSVELEHLDDPAQRVVNRIPTEVSAENFEEARRNYEIVRDFYPNHELAAVIAERLANFKLQRAVQLQEQGDVALARDAYYDASNWFPETQAGKEARLLASKMSHRMEVMLGLIGLGVLIGLLIPPIADAYGRRLEQREMTRRNHYQTACLRFARSMSRFQQTSGAEGVGIIPKAIIIFLGAIIFVPSVAIFTALYLPIFLVMNFVHWIGLAHRGIFYQCPYHDCGARFREPVHVCSCGTKYKDLYPSFFGLFHHTCLNKHGKTGITKRLPTLDSLGRSKIERLCGACGRRLLHRTGYEMPVYPIALVGGQTVGKTVYLHQTVDQLEETYNSPGHSRRVFIDSDDDQLRHDDMMDSLRFGELPHKTTQDYAALGLAVDVRERDLKLRALVHLFDAPGERFGAMESFGRMQVVQFLKGILFFVDVTPFLKDTRPDMVEIAKPSGDDIHTIANNLVNGVNMLRLDDVRESCDIPISVVVTKADAIPKNRLDDVRSALVEFGGERLVRKLENKFTNLRYFACSALGRSPFPYDDAPFEPDGVVEPLRFLLEAR